jgi:hypothetical protein
MISQAAVTEVKLGTLKTCEPSFQNPANSEKYKSKATPRKPLLQNSNTRGNNRRQSAAVEEKKAQPLRLGREASFRF